MSIKNLTILCTALAASAFAPAHAADPDYTLGFNIGAVSDYRFRGISLTSFDPAIQGGVDFSHKSGLYLGTWASNVKWIKDYVGATKGSTVIDFYGGFNRVILKPALQFSTGVESITTHWTRKIGREATKQRNTGSRRQDLGQIRKEERQEAITSARSEVRSFSSLEARNYGFAPGSH